MVGDEQAITKPGASASKRRGRLRLLIPAGLVIVAALILFRAAGSLITGAGSGSAPLLAIGQIGSDRATTIEQGRRLYGQDCASCHGARGDRVAAAPLNSRQFVD